MFNVSGSDIGEGDVSYRFTLDVKAGLIFRWAHMGFFCLIDAFMFHFNEPRLEKTAQLVSYIVQFLSFLNLIFHAPRRLLRLYNMIFDGPGRKSVCPFLFKYYIIILVNYCYFSVSPVNYSDSVN